MTAAGICLVIAAEIGVFVDRDLLQKRRPPAGGLGVTAHAARAIGGPARVKRGDVPAVGNVHQPAGDELWRSVPSVAAVRPSDLSERCVTALVIPS